MKNKLLYILPILIATILAVTLASAATTLISPVAGTNYSTAMTLNCTTAINSSTNQYNVSFYYDASGGATTTLLTTVWNTSAAQNTFTSASYSITSLADLKTYNFTCYANNGTFQEWSVGAKGIAKDTVAPVITFDVKQKSINPNGLIEAKCSYTDATTGTTSASYFQYINPASTTNTLTADGTYQAISNEKTSQEGNYAFSCYAIDYSGNAATTETATTTNTGFTINLTNQQTGGAGIPRWIIFVVIGVLIYLAVTYKKK